MLNTPMLLRSTCIRTAGAAPFRLPLNPNAPLQCGIGKRLGQPAAAAAVPTCLQVPGGAQLLCEQGVVSLVLLLCKWLLAPEGGDLMGETPAPSGGRTQVRPWP